MAYDTKTTWDACGAAFDRYTSTEDSFSENIERPVIEAILDEAVVCHVGFAVEGQPFVIPTIHARVGDTLYLHGSPASRMLRELSGSVEVCVTATLLDGVVLARSVYKSSLNYRSAVVFGRARKVEDGEEKRLALEAVVEHVAPGRSNEARAPSSSPSAWPRRSTRCPSPT